MKKVLCALLTLVLVFLAVSCGDSADLWSYAKYTEDQTFGEGSKTVVVTVKVLENSVDFTIKSDRRYLGDALFDNELIEGEEGQYGLYITSVNGMAIAEGEQAYWALYKDGAYSFTGVDTTPIANGECYELVKESY